jgi:hypothetical protein
VEWWEPLLVVPVLVMGLIAEVSFQRALSKSVDFESSAEKQRLLKELVEAQTARKE